MSFASFDAASVFAAPQFPVPYSLLFSSATSHSAILRQALDRSERTARGPDFTNMPPAERRERLCRAVDMLPEDVGCSIPRELSAAGVPENKSVLRAPPALKVLTKCRRCFSPNGADSVFATLWSTSFAPPSPSVSSPTSMQHAFKALVRQAIALSSVGKAKAAKKSQA